MLKYFIELPATNMYIKNTLYDTNKINEAKFFNTFEQAKVFIKNYCSGVYTNIRIYKEFAYAV